MLFKTEDQCRTEILNQYGKTMGEGLTECMGGIITVPKCSLGKCLAVQELP